MFNTGVHGFLSSTNELLIVYCYFEYLCINNVLLAKPEMNAVLLIFVLCLSSHVMLCKSRSQSEIYLFQSDFVEALWLNILPIILTNYKKVRSQGHWYDK